MKLTRANFGQLMTPVHSKVFWNSYQEKAPQYTALVDVGEMRMKSETFLHEGGFGMWTSNTEGNTINESSMSEGDYATFTAERYDNGYELTWELIKDDLYNVMKGIGKGGSAKALGKGLRTLIEYNCAAIINGGFANTGYDGVALFANSHPLIDSASTCDNLTTGAITDATVKGALTLLRGHVDEANLKIEAKADIVFCAADKEWDLYTILGSDRVAGDLSNDKNVIPRLRPVVNDYLTSGYWGVKDSSFENLCLKWREKPIFDSQPISKTIDYFMFGFARFDTGYTDFRGIVASAG
jgi:hypothetical protein